MPGREDIFQKAMNEGHSAAWDQEWNKAASAYRSALQEMPDHPKALNSLGLALFQQGNYEESLQIYKRVAQLTPQDPSPMENSRNCLSARVISKKPSTPPSEPQTSSSINAM